MRNIFIAICIPMILPLGGCIAALENGPKRLYSEDEQNQLLRSTLPVLDLTSTYSAPQRNNYITARMYAIDLNYTAYYTKLTKERQLGTLASDLAIIGLGAATAVTGTAQTKAILGAATTAVGGARADVDKDVLLSQTVQILQNEMEVERAAIRARIIKNLKEKEEDYTMAQGLSDLEDYYRAGTLAGALESLSSTVGRDAKVRKQIKDDGVKTEARAPVDP